MRTALYIRVSSEEQATKGNSLFEQEERGRAYCRAMGWDDPVIYTDDGYSAKDLNRPEITRLLENIKNSDYDIIITTKLDRLSRKLADILSLVDYFEKYKSAYASVSESFDTSTSSGKLTLQVLGAVAEFERERIRERVQENLRSLARQGKLYGKPAYGYNVIDGSYEVNIEESLIVKSIFRWTLEGKGPLWIAGHLNAMSIPTKNKAQWNERRIREMLSLETYIGQFIYNRKYRKGTVEVVRPKEEWIIVEDRHEPLIDLDTWGKVQSILNSRRRGARQYHADDRYLLSGLVYCTHCGNKMHGRQVQRPQNKIKKIEYRYLCSGYQKKAVCSYHAVIRDELEQVIISSIEKITTESPDRLKLIASEPEAKLSERDLLKAKRNKLDQRMQKQIEAYESDAISLDDLKKARQRIDNERQSIQQALEDVDQANDVSEQRRIQDKAKRLLDDVLSDDRVVAKQAIAQLIHQIHITNSSDVHIVWDSK